MSNDPIVEELDRLRAEQMESYHFDFEAFFRDLKGIAAPLLEKGPNLGNLSY